MTRPTITFDMFGELPPSANVLHRMNRYDWGRLRAQWKADTYLTAKDAVNRQRWVAPRLKAHVKVLFHFEDRRRRDPDNYTAGLKGVLDGLVEAGVIRDDDFASIVLSVDAKFAAKEPGLTIEVEPIFNEEGAVWAEQ